MSYPTLQYRLRRQFARALSCCLLIGVFSSQLDAQVDEFGKYSPQHLTDNMNRSLLDEYKRNLGDLLDKRALNRQEIQQLEHQQNSIFEKRLEISQSLSSIPASYESFNAIRSSLETQLTKLQIDLIGLEARRKEILRNRDEMTEQSAVIQNRLQEKQKEVAQRILQIERKRYDHVQSLYNDGAVSEDSVAEAKRAVLEAEINVLATEESIVSQQQTNSEVQSLLLGVSIEIASSNAKVEFIKGKLAQMQSHSLKIEELKNLEQNKLPIINSQLKEMRNNLSQKLEQFVLEKRISEIKTHLNNQASKKQEEQSSSGKSSDDKSETSDDG